MVEVQPTPTASDPGSSASVRFAVYPRSAVLRAQSWFAEYPQVDSPRAPFAASGIDTRMLGVGPGDWLIVSDTFTASDLQARFGTAAAAARVALTDVTHGLVSLALFGRAARDVLSKGCGLDLHPARFPVGHCVRTRLAQIAVILDCLDGERFDLYFASSYTAYLREWLTDAAVEFNSEASHP